MQSRSVALQQVITRKGQHSGWFMPREARLIAFRSTKMVSYRLAIFPWNAAELVQRQINIVYAQ